MQQKEKRQLVRNQRFLWYQRELNQRHTDFQSVALPTELWYPVCFALQKYNFFQCDDKKKYFFYFFKKCQTIRSFSISLQPEIFKHE